MNLKQKIISKARLISCLFLLLFNCESNDEKISINSELKAYFELILNNQIQLLDSFLNSSNQEEQKEIYKKIRFSFKESEPLLTYYNKAAYYRLNQPNILKVSEESPTEIKEVYPLSYQVVEENLFSDSPNENLVYDSIKTAKGALNLTLINLYIKSKPYHYIYMLHNEIVRVATLNLTGFDSPILNQSIKETKHVYVSLKNIIKIFKPLFKNQNLYNSWLKEIDISIEVLNNGSFETFDRYSFHKKHINKQLELINETIEDWSIDMPYKFSTNVFSSRMFSEEFFNIESFSNEKTKKMDTLMVDFGKMLFNDKRLSINNDMNCASCHKSDLAFTDGLKLSIGQKRNSPTLKYSGFQRKFFYDNRALDLEDQIFHVVENDSEFHASSAHLVNVIENDSIYKSFMTKKSDSENQIINAIATYVRSLAPFNSKFDNNINNYENSLTPNEINGYNLFTGKAGCATCHFAPLFNGTVPPLYKESEMELIGIPETKEEIQVSTDMGRFNYFKTESRKYFFKTPTIRNIAKTAPYMHNGVYHTLEEVISFYNRGGGNGLGYSDKLEYQTLPSNSLDLSDKEINDLISFMNTLTDLD